MALVNNASRSIIATSNFTFTNSRYPFKPVAMKVEELIIDGFKSYATRTVISGWDASFNCITGLNGSGKSNILDAICFVLGITTMSTVRAQNLQDLIYKRGQAGVTKASVTIVFDNSDKEKSPIGFEDQARISVTRQIVLGGTSKFLINGHRAQQQTVQQLFQSVQLNINNPNFLIMQGRITKVLNMKPAEILALIAEAAGTRMFEERREKAAKVMAKKEKKVEEIRELLQEEIEPKLENLRSEKRTFLEYQQTQTELERMEKLVVSHDYLKYSHNTNSKREIVEAKRAGLQEAESLISKTKSELVNLQQEIDTLKKQRLEQMQKGGRFQALEKKVKELSQESARLNTLVELKATNIKEESSKRDNVSKAIAQLEAKIEQGSDEFKALEKAYETAKTEFESLKEELTKKEELLQSLQTGVSSKSGGEVGYAEQLQQAKSTVSQAQTAIGKAKVRIDFLKKAITKDESKTTQARSENESLLSSLENLKQEVERLKARMEGAGWVPGRLQELKKEESSLLNEVRSHNNEVEQMKRKISNLDFSYSKPSANFNPNSVKGLVAQLFTIDKKNYNASTALEVCAGGRLFNVVVDTDDTAAQLLQKGQLRKRVTIIPLNKISSFRIAAEKLGAAQKLAPGKVDLALNLIGYDDSLVKAMEYVFGSTIICKDAESAKKVTFDPNIRVKTVTLDGDIYDPMGTLSGGSSGSSGSGFLVSVQKYNELNARLSEKKKQLQELRSKITDEEKIMTQCKDIKKQLDLKEHEITLSQKQLDSSSSAKILNTYKERTEELQKLEEQIVKDTEAVSKGEVEIEQIERDISEFGQNKGAKLKQLSKEVDKLKTTIDKQKKVVQKSLETFQNAQLEKGQLGDDLSTRKSEHEEAVASIKELEQSLKSLQSQFDKVKSEEEEAITTLEKEKENLTGIDDELKETVQAHAAKEKFVTEKGLECQKLGHEVEKLSKELEESQRVVQGLLKEYSWIPEQEEYFGQSGSPYDFKRVNVNECRQSLKRLQERIKGMKKNVNTKVMNTIESVEKKEADLKHMVTTIEKDRRKIESTISTLNDYKRQALIKTWEKVSADFGQIFADLLPGGYAKLEPSEGKDVTEGLEIKVALGKVWKDGLAELSGGQRSLAALSLILALLQFKPAPMYILDEVDAALDLHHTQNIGHIIKTRFKGSQFIVVSLKEGMFSNANRLFRARFHEGTSTVSVM